MLLSRILAVEEAAVDHLVVLVAEQVEMVVERLVVLLLPMDLVAAAEMALAVFLMVVELVRQV